MRKRGLRRESQLKERYDIQTMEEREHKKERLRRFLDFGKIALLLSILVAVGIISAIVGMQIAIRGNEVVVPDLSNLEVEAAKQTLGKLELDLNVQGNMYSSNVAKGRVMRQSPEPGESIKAGQSIQVMLSLGERTSPVPDFSNSMQRVAQLTAAQYNYEIGHVSRISMPDTEEGTVLSQYPPPHSEKATSPKVSLLVSAGDGRRFLMPDFIGKNLNLVRSILEKKEFEVGQIEYRFYRNVRKGTVVRQFPRPGHVIREGEEVNLEVAR